MHVIFAGKSQPAYVIGADWVYGDLDRGTGHLSVFFSKAKAMPHEYQEVWKLSCRSAKPLF
jgi:hypothetical protein